MPALFLALTAVRRNEMLGTYKDDVDLAEGTVFIERQQMRDHDTCRPHGQNDGRATFPQAGTTEPWLDTTFSSLLRDAAKGVGSRLAPSGSAVSSPPPAANRAWLSLVPAKVLGNSERVNHAPLRRPGRRGRSGCIGNRS